MKYQQHLPGGTATWAGAREGGDAGGSSGDLPYRLAGLLYTPAVEAEKTLRKILERAWCSLRSVVFCLEDSIMDSAVSMAEAALLSALENHAEAIVSCHDFPMMFIRVRSPEHLRRLHERLGHLEDVITGYVLPKFDTRNSIAYMESLQAYNDHRGVPLYFMPILESHALASIGRSSCLLELKRELDQVKPLVLNIRVGANDFCNIFGLRRSVGQTIYDFGVIKSILVDILNVFMEDYVVSGPVWEYFGESWEAAWQDGLRREIRQDQTQGFIGKTCIHPVQLSIVEESLKVSGKDYDDARSILQWSSEVLGVARSQEHHRMNEVKCHTKWAKRIVTLGGIYGIRGD